MNISEVYLEPCQTSKMELFAKVVNSFYPQTSFSKSSILDIYLGTEWASLLFKRQPHKMVKHNTLKQFVGFCLRIV